MLSRQETKASKVTFPHHIAQETAASKLVIPAPSPFLLLQSKQFSVFKSYNAEGEIHLDISYHAYRKKSEGIQIIYKERCPYIKCHKH